MAAIAVVLDQTTAGALYEPGGPFTEAVAAFYVQASGGLGRLYAPVLSLAEGDAAHPGLLAYVDGLRFVEVESFGTAAALAAVELRRAGYSWAAAHAIHAALPSVSHPEGRFLLTLTPDAYAGTGVRAVHPGQ
ncbi:hypothetical protein [Streptomyces sp. NPDC017940]|uniref:hypothetical protein n=1 Tax=Streptomyces sp. NPDC017940 TaxID=3365017 RepID=UPI00379BC350